MKKSYSWQILLLVLAFYLILLAFFPALSILFDYLNFTLLIALGFLWLGAEQRNAILFCIGLAFSTLYLDQILPYGRFDVNITPLFLGLLILGLAIHSILKKRNYQKLVDFQASQPTVISNDSEFLHLNASFSEQCEYSNATALKAITVKALFGKVVIDLSGAQFDKEVTYVSIKQTASTTILRLPRRIQVVNGLKSSFGQVQLPIQTGQAAQQIYLTGSNTFSTVSIHYVD